MTKGVGENRQSPRAEVKVGCRCTLVERDNNAKVAGFSGLVTDSTFAGCRIESADFPREHMARTGRGELLINCEVELNGTLIAVQGVQRWTNERQPLTFGMEFVKSKQGDTVASLHRLLHPKQSASRSGMVFAALVVVVVGLAWWSWRPTATNPTSSNTPQMQVVGLKTSQVAHTHEAGLPSATKPMSGSQQENPEETPADEAKAPPPSPVAPVFFMMENVQQNPGEFSATFKTNRPHSEHVKFRFTDQNGSLVDTCRLSPNGPDVAASCTLGQGQQITGILPYE